MLVFTTDKDLDATIAQQTPARTTDVLVRRAEALLHRRRTRLQVHPSQTES